MAFSGPSGRAGERMLGTSQGKGVEEISGKFTETCASRSLRAAESKNRPVQREDPLSQLLSSHGILVMIGRYENVRIQLVRFGRRPVRGKACDWPWSRIATLVPTLVVIDIEGHVVVQLLDFPHAVFFHV